MRTGAPTGREIELLLCEARRYLLAVDVFRAEGHEPSWRPERGRPTTKRPIGRVVRSTAP